MQKIIDVTTFNGEKELFDLRYNILEKAVDNFIVIEFDKTFSGKPKQQKFNQYYDKVEYHFVSENTYKKYWQEALNSPNTNYGKGAEHWLMEWCQKESIKDYLTNNFDENIIYIGDVDEIWQPFPADDNLVFKLKLKVFTYWLNNKSTEQFWGTIVGKYKNIKGKCLNHIRSTNHIKTNIEWGWHFTSMGGYENVKQKLTDSYTKETYANELVIQNLQQNIETTKDFLGRDFVYMIDESEWPEYLKQHKNKYSQLCLK